MILTSIITDVIVPIVSIVTLVSCACLLIYDVVDLITDAM